MILMGCCVWNGFFEGKWVLTLAFWLTVDRTLGIIPKEPRIFTFILPLFSWIFCRYHFAKTFFLRREKPLHALSSFEWLQNDISSHGACWNIFVLWVRKSFVKLHRKVVVLSSGKMMLSRKKDKKCLSVVDGGLLKKLVENGTEESKPGSVSGLRIPYVEASRLLQRVFEMKESIQWIPYNGRPENERNGV